MTTKMGLGLAMTKLDSLSIMVSKCAVSDLCALIGNTLTKAGNTVNENNHDKNVPIAAALPSATAGGKSLKLRLKKPIAVVRLVIDTAKKFTFKLALMASSLGLVRSSTNSCVNI